MTVTVTDLKNFMFSIIFLFLCQIAVQIICFLQLNRMI